MNNVISCENVSKGIREELKANSKSYMIKPCLAVIEVGEELLNELSIKKLDDACNECGVYLKIIKFSVNALEKEITNRIIELNNDEYINGIEVLMPLPSNLNTQRILNHITSSKDIEGMNDVNSGRLFNFKDGMISPFALAILEVLKQSNIEIQGSNAVVVGRGKLIGKQIAMLLLRENATVTICHTGTKDLKNITKNADILVSATGNKNLISKSMVKDNSVVVDAGICYEDENIFGDVGDEVKEKANVISMNDGLLDLGISMLIKNVIKCYEKNKVK